MWLYSLVYIRSSCPYFDCQFIFFTACSFQLQVFQTPKVSTIVRLIVDTTLCSGHSSTNRMHIWQCKFKTCKFNTVNAISTLYLTVNGPSSLFSTVAINISDIFSYCLLVSAIPFDWIISRACAKEKRTMQCHTGNGSIRQIFICTCLALLKVSNDLVPVKNKRVRYNYAYS